MSSDPLFFSSSKQHLQDHIARDALQETTLLHVLQRRAAAHPDDVIYTYLTDGETEEVHLTFGGLWTKACAIAAKLRQIGATGERALCIYLPGLDYAPALLGCFLAGVVAVPESPPDMQRPERSLHRLQAIAANARAAFVLVPSALLSLQKKAPPALSTATWIATDDLSAPEIDEEPALPDPEALAYLQYTSGSTADPKGVMLTHANLMHNCRQTNDPYALGSDGITVSWVPTFHNLGLLYAIAMPIFTGSRCVSFDAVCFVERPIRWMRAISRYRGTHSIAPSSAFDLAVLKTRPEEREGLDLTSCQALLTGGEPTYWAREERFVEAYSPFGFDRRAIVHSFGTAEATAKVTTELLSHRMTFIALEPDAFGRGEIVEVPLETQSARVLAGCGVPSPETTLVVVDPETGRLLPPDRVGELWIQGPSVGKGYWDNPRATAETFGAVIADTGDGPWLRTGDLVFLHDGQLFVAGRQKDTIIVRGQNHYPEDLEGSLRNVHPEIRSGAIVVFSVSHPESEHVVIVAEIQPENISDPGPIHSAIRGALAEHGLRPSTIVLAPPGTIAKTASGKVQRRATKRAFMDGKLAAVFRWDAPPEVVPAEETTEIRWEVSGLSPEQRVERLLALVRSEAALVLGLSGAEAVDPDARLQYFGFDSLMAIDLRNRLDRKTGARLDIGALLRFGTPTRIAEALEESYVDEPPVSLTTSSAALAELAPLSSGQARLYFLDRVIARRETYNVHLVARIGTALDPMLLEEALQSLVARHEELRVQFVEQDGIPFQQVLSKLHVPVAFVDLTNMPEAARAAELERLAKIQGETPFDLATPPLLRLTLVRLSAEESALVLTWHHIVTDGWSAGVFLRELSAAYTALAAGTAMQWPEGPSYRLHVERRRAWLEGQEAEEQRRFWREELAGAPKLDLPTDRVKPAERSGAGGVVAFSLNREVSDGIDALARRTGSTPFVVLFSGLAVLLHRYSGQKDFSVGVVASGREGRGLEDAIGFFVNTLPVRCKWEGDPPVQQFIEALQERIWSALDHEALPFDEIVRAIPGAYRGDAGESPLFGVAFALEDSAWLTEPFAGAPFETLGRSVGGDVEGTAKFELALAMIRTSAGYRASIEYDADLFDEQTVSRWSEHYRRLLESFVAAPTRRLSALAILTDAEKAKFAAWNETKADYPDDKCVHELFEEQVDLHPDVFAVEYEGARLTYAELDARANQLAHFLRGMGIGPEVRVGLCVERSIEMVVGFMAILKAGGAYVPLDPTYPRDRLAFMITDARVPVMLTKVKYQNELSACGARVVCLDAERVEWAELPRARVRSGVRPDNAMYAVYTSGSTGRPKGVINLHRGLAAHVGYQRATYPVYAKERMLQHVSVAFDGTVLDWTCALCNGATLVLASANRGGSGGVGEYLDNAGITAAFIPPALLGGLDCKAPDLRLVITGSDYTPDEVARRWSIGREIKHLYGPTEFSIYGTGCNFREGDQRLNIGGPIHNARVHVVDGSVNLVPIGIPGEICLSGIGIARGYLNRPGLTAERFVADPFSTVPGARMYRTGDLGRWNEDGQLEFLGRIDHQVKLRGYRIELGEIEFTLSSHPLVRACGVIVREDVPGEKRIVAYVVPASSECTPSLLRAHLQKSLPEYMLPSIFVLLDAMPRSPNGKLDLKALPPPEGSREGVGLSYVAPRTDTERALAGVWEKVLGIQPIGARDDFFALGGHSLLAARLISALKSELGVVLPMASVFRHRTIEALAAQVKEKPAAALFCPTARDRSEEPYSGLSGTERRLWFIERLYPEARSYQVPQAFRVTGALDMDALRVSLERLLRRHELLRTRYPEVDGSPVRVVSEDVQIPVCLEDVSLLANAERDAAIRELIAREVGTAFDLEQGPLMRALVIRSEGEFIVLLNQHHIVTDEWSSGVLLRELSALYEAAERGEDAALPALAYQYADYARAEQEALSGEGLAESRAYWKQKLSGAPRLSLPMLRPGTGKGPGPEAHAALELPVESSNAFARLAREHDCTPFMAWYALVTALLSRYSEETDVAIGAVVANRDIPGTEGLLGFFTNTVVLRLDLSGDPTFGELFARARQTAVDAYRHQAVPFDAVVRDLGVERRADETPLYDLSFIEATEPDAPSSRWSSGWNDVSAALSQGQVSAKDPLGVAVQHGPTGTSIVVSFDTTRVERRAVDRLLGHLQALVMSVVAHPDKRLSELEMLTDAEHAQLVAWNDTKTDYPADQHVHEQFEEQVSKAPDAIAVVFEDEELTYAELDARANQLAHHLRSLGVGPEVLVGLCVEPSLEMIVGMLAILKAGGAYVPLDPAYPAERLAFMLEDARVALVLTQARLVNELPVCDARVLRFDADAAQWAGEPKTRPRSGVLPDSPVYVIYTSGSTGQPKGVVISHRAFDNELYRAIDNLRLDARDSFVQQASISFDASVWECWLPLICGGRLILTPRGLAHSPAELSALIERRGVTILQGVPSFFEAMLECPAFAEQKSLRLLSLGGEALSLGLYRSLRTRLENCTIWNTYGPTEATIDVIEWRMAEFRGDVVPIGVPGRNVRVHVLDSALRRVPIGVPGELYLSGVQLARAYLNRRGVTAEKFLPDPFASEPGARMYRTGDLVRWNEEGQLEFVGRIDHQVKISGFRIELGEIESALGAHASVRSCVVLVREDVPGSKRLVAYVVPATSECSPARLRDHLQKTLPEYMIPSAFVQLDALPLSANGKVDRKALPAPEGSREASGTSYVAPRTDMERALAGVWEKVLGIHPIGARDDFFALGGHSLLAVRLISALKSELGVVLPMASVFRYRTIEALAAQVKEKPSAGLFYPTARDQSEAPYSGLSGTERRLWFLERLYPEARSYQVPQAFRIRGAFDLDALRVSLERLLQRHELLRTRYPEVDGTPVRVVSEDVQIPVCLEDVSLLANAERDAAIRELIAREVGTAFDLEQGPLTRVLVIRSEGEFIVLLHQHHIVTDEWSSEVLLRELSALYEAAERGEDAALPALAYQYADYAKAEQEALAGEGLAESRAYWKQKLSGAPRLSLPMLRPGTGKGPGPEAHAVLELPVESSNAFARLAREHGCTPFMAWYALVTALLSRYSEETDVAIGAVVANRDIPGTEGLLGFFTNTVVLRLDLSGDPTFGKLFARARQTAVDAYRHQAVPFDVVVRDLGVERRADETPLYDVSFIEASVPDAPSTEWDDISGALSQGQVSAKDPLGIAVQHGPTGTTIVVSFDTTRVERRAVDRLLGHLQALVMNVVAHPDKRLSELEMLTDAEHAQLAAWNDTKTDYPADQHVHEQFEEQVCKAPDAIAVVFEDEELTYTELDARANQLAHHLRSLGVGPEVLVGLCVERSLEMVVGMAAVVKAGGAYVPLDPAYPAERLAFMLEDARVGLVLSQGQLVSRLPECDARVVCLDADEAQWAGEPKTTPRSGVLSENPVYVIYTSGSTGQPKGVVTSHRALGNEIHRTMAGLQLDARDIFLQQASISFDASVWECWLPLVTGGRLILAPRGPVHSPAELSALIESRRVTILQGVPSFFEAMVECSTFVEQKSLRHLCLGGEALSSGLYRSLRRLENCTTWNMYGPTEATIDAIEWSKAEFHGDVVPIGVPGRNVRVHVLDSALRRVPIGVPGELYLSGVQLARGYLNRRGVTAEKFLPDPFASEPGARMYRTGDLVRWNEEGQLEFVGRIDHQVKMSGFRIELGEIESALGTHASVRSCGVLVREDVPGNKRLVAYVVPVSSECTPSLLRAHLQKTLPEYMIPSAFVLLDALPLSPNGKVDRKALPAPEGSREAAGASYVAPRTLVEEALVELWEQLFALRPIGIHDDFFALGGHSLLAVRLVAAIERRFGQTVALSQLFSQRTVAGLAHELSLSFVGASRESPLVALRKTGAKPPLFCVHAIGGSAFVYQDIARELGDERPVYAFQARLLKPDAPRAEESIEEMAARYLSAMREVQPDGPYHLCGWSFGGVVALEMAQQLSRAGIPVASLVLLDSMVPREEDLDAPADPIGLLPELAIFSSELEPRVIGIIEATAGAHARSLARYAVKPYGGVMNLLLAHETLAWDGARIEREWERVCAGGVRLHEVPGTHDSMVLPPHAAVLSRVLQNIL